ncbi:MAG: preprotein translocase subunit SecA [Rickettsiales bacterium]|nr:preprotein translocase subunit SecA [Rickettsiales bacterium]
MLQIIAKKIFGSVNDRSIKALKLDVIKINELEPSISKLSDTELQNKTNEFKDYLKNGGKVDDLLHQAFAVVREASKRILQMRHFDVQLMGGIALHQGKISEMRTGEGKTLVATLPCYLNGLTGRGVHLVTINDYLAKRDSEWMGRLYQFLGLTVGCITSDSDEVARRNAYNCDITYATNNELGFDYLRDQIKYRLEDTVQKPKYYAIVDEVDSILIDEARTPLIISGPTNDNSKLYQQINQFIPLLKKEDYLVDEKEKAVSFTEQGIENVETMLKNSGIIEIDSNIYDSANILLVHHLNQALKAHKIFKNEIDYIVKNGSVIIIDEFTGRMQEGRRFSDGLHQALEAKEDIKIRNENQTLASITFQNYFRLYEKLAGMTGTASTEALEFEEIYNLKVIEIPTNQSIARIDEEDEIYKTEKSKLNAVLKTIKECYEKEQPVLVGTISIEKSEQISKLLKENKLPHNVLNAKYHQQEAEIVAEAGAPKAITIATNMAGRGTDIKLGGNIEKLIGTETDHEKIKNIEAEFAKNKERVIKSGGLYIIGTERHESRRIDNQLRGRSGRQGDPGNSKFFLSLEDDLMRIFGSEKLGYMLSKLGLEDDEAIIHPWITKTLEKAQQKVETRNYEIRKNLLKYDDVMNQQRKIIFALREDVLTAVQIIEKINEISKEINQHIVNSYLRSNIEHSDYELEAEKLDNEIIKIYGIKINSYQIIEEQNFNHKAVEEAINQKTFKIFKDKIELYGEDAFKQVATEIFLSTLDFEWKDHLLSLDKLRNSINLRAYAQKDPLLEYKKEAFDLFEEMLARIEEQTISYLSHLKISMQSNKNNDLDDIINNNQITNYLNSNDKKEQSRNESCSCGSGKKFKYCHGKIG